MAQIIKNRRGPIGNLKNATANNAEVIVASGSISDLSGPFVFIGSPTLTDNGTTGAFKSVSKIYTGANAPTISNTTYGTTLDGTPFYASNNQSLYVLANDGVGNSRLDLTGNIEDNTISNVTINTLDGDVEVLGNITGSNLQLSGDADITGNIVLGGNITLGDQDVDFVSFNADVSSSILPDTDNTFDLGSPSKQWANIYVDTANIVTSSFSGDLSVSGSAEIAGGVQLLSTLDVDGQSTLSSVAVEDLTSGRVVLAGSSGEIEDSANLTFDGSTLTTDGNISGSGGLNIDAQSSIASLKVEDLINNRLVIAGTGGELEDDANFTFDGTTFDIGQGNFTVDNSTGNTDIAGTLDVDGQSTLASLNVEDLTSDRLIFAGTNGELEDSAALTFDGSTLTSTATISGSSNLNIDGQASLASLNVEDLTSGRITFSGTNGELEDDSNLRFESNTFKVGDTNFNVDATNGNTTIAGTLNVGANTILESDVFVSGNLTLLGNTTELIVSSSTVELDDNIIRLNAYSPFERYAGFEVIDSGSVGVSASLQWDSLNDYWLIQSSSQQSGKVISTTYGTFGSEASLTDNTIPKATAENSIGDSLLIDDGSNLTYDTDAINIASTTGNTSIKGIVSLTNSGGTDGGTNTSAILFRNSSDELGYVPTTETTNVLDGILGYRSSTGALEFSTVIDGGTF